MSDARSLVNLLLECQISSADRPTTRVERQAPNAQRRWLSALALLLCLFAADSALAQQAKKTEPPRAKPKFGPEVEKVFFEDAFKKLGEGGLPGDSSPVKTAPKPGVPLASGGGPGPMPMPPGGSDPAPAGTAEGTWSTILPPDVLENEIKLQAIAAAQAAKVKGKFKSESYKDARVQFSVLATFFGVIAIYDKEEVRWKEHAAGFRDELAKVGFLCKEGNDASQAAAADQSALLGELIGGQKIASPKGASGTVPWPNVAEMYPLMKRLQIAQMTTLKPFTASEAEFKSNQEKIVHECHIIAALATMIADAEFNEEEGYHNIAIQMQQQALMAAQSAKQGDFTGTQQAVTGIAKSCTDCHAKYK